VFFIPSSNFRHIRNTFRVVPSMELPVNYSKIHFSGRKKVREKYIEIQEGRCYYCDGDLTTEPPKKVSKKKINKNLFPKGFFNHPIHLHHDHDTGMTIGAVHCYCNAVLWQYHGE
jgi:hypothetical protein